MTSVLGNRRPLDLDSDDETEGEDKQPIVPKTSEQVIAEADELVVKKKVRHSKPFTEDVLTHPDGIQRIYEEFPVSCKFRGRGSEAKDVKKLLTMYREWAFQLHPGLAFPDIVSKCESLGSKGKTRSCILNLRERERTRYIVSQDDILQILVPVSLHSLTQLYYSVGTERSVGRYKCPERSGCVCTSTGCSYI